MVEVLWASEYHRVSGKEKDLKDLGCDETIVFEVYMTTHSGDLRGYNMQKEAELVIDENITVSPISAELASNDGPHPIWVLSFPKLDELGRSLIRDDSTSLRLVLRNLNNVPSRDFKWKLPIQPTR